jgi:hypothetical protein
MARKKKKGRDVAEFLDRPTPAQRDAAEAYLRVYEMVKDRDDDDETNDSMATLALALHQGADLLEGPGVGGKRRGERLRPKIEARERDIERIVRAGLKANHTKEKILIDLRAAWGTDGRVYELGLSDDQLRKRESRIRNSLPKK